MLKASNVTIDESRRFRGETPFYGASVDGCVSFLGAVGLAGGRERWCRGLVYGVEVAGCYALPILSFEIFLKFSYYLRSLSRNSRLATRNASYI